MTHHRDPDRRRPAPPHPGFEEREIDVDIDVCRWCAVHVPADEKQRVKHEDWDQRIANRLIQLAERVALLEATIAQLSDPGSRTAPGAPGDDASASPGSGQTSPGSVARGVGQIIDPGDAKSPPAPPPGEPSRGGVGGSNHQSTQPGAGDGSPDASSAPDPSSPGGSGATEGSRPGARRSGSSAPSAPGREPTSEPEPAEPWWPEAAS